MRLGDIAEGAVLGRKVKLKNSVWSVLCLSDMQMEMYNGKFKVWRSSERPWVKI